ncbi:hypothetical protein NC651_000631 [Populus alba x Populus x berolinensis]|nr:hypothetical protein NC651_000631 [Populus alba x Populus x berolinensis]
MVVSAMEMLIGGVCEEDSVPSGGKTCNCGGVPLDCNLTDLSEKAERNAFRKVLLHRILRTCAWRKWLLLQCPCEKNFSQKEIHSGGHLDAMEADWSKPIVSMRYLGNSLFYHFLQRFQPKEEAIFLSGGKSREDPPLAVFLQSGDVVPMAGEARECFHAKNLPQFIELPHMKLIFSVNYEEAACLARIFSNKENTEIATLESHFCDEKDFLEFIRTSRININTRQVF